jgi:SAM-dependent methyltransferase
MGFSVGTLHHLTWLGRNGHIPRAGRYLDFGSQNIFEEFPRPQVEDFLAVFSSKDRYSPKLTQPGAKIEDLMAAADFEYVAFDMYTDGRTREFDLNFDSLPESMCGAFDVVANFGTSEHIVNQYNVFKVAHDALKVGGVHYSFLPFFGGVNHGLFNYHPKFFTTLIANNSYQPLYWDFSNVFKSNEDFYRDLSTAINGSAWEGKYVGSALMNVIFKKSTSAPFEPPTDSVSVGDVSLGYPTVNEILKAGKGDRAKSDSMHPDLEVERLKHEIEMIRSSRSWRITAPLRSFTRWVRRWQA